MNEFDMFKFTEPKSFPVILLLDTSGSMSGWKIDALNTAVRTMLSDFAKQKNNNAVIKVAIFKFGPDAQQVLDIMEAGDALGSYQDLTAHGGTPLAEALRLSKSKVIEDRDVLNKRFYRPSVILVSDGRPNTGWQSALEEFLSTGRSSKCQRISLGIDVDSDEVAYKVLQQFASKEELVFMADEADKIRGYFKFITDSTIEQFKATTEQEFGKALQKTVSQDEDEDDDGPF